jgi:hypothetical protein
MTNGFKEDLNEQMNEVKMSFFSFFLYKIGEQEGRIGHSGGWGVGTSQKGGWQGKGGRRVNMMQIVCTHVCKCKNDTC